MSLITGDKVLPPFFPVLVAPSNLRMDAWKGKM
jgi:hypothetical protein